jgi:prepilin-type processing-associated H-X9-DG protein
MMRLLRKNSVSALSRVEVLVIMFVIALLVCFSLPYLRRARERSRLISCNSNLKGIGSTFRIWDMDHSGKFPMQLSVTNGGVIELVETNPFSIFQVMSNEFGNYRAKVLVCPADALRCPATNFTTDFSSEKISYFVGLDASDSMPQMFLTGDRNLATNGVSVLRSILELTTNQIAGWTQEIHKNQGNVGMADGSVQGFSNRALNEALQNTGVATNRLAIP